MYAIVRSMQATSYNFSDGISWDGAVALLQWICIARLAFSCRCIRLKAYKLGRERETTRRARYLH